MQVSLGWMLRLFLALTFSASAPPSPAAAQQQPYTFFFTRYELTGPMDKPEAVRYHSDGQPSAKALDGSSVSLSGRGAWDPASKRAEGGGQYTIKDPAGAVKAQGAWRVTGFTSFRQLPGWWGMPGLKEEGWQGPPGSASFSGFLTVNVNLENLGDGVLEAWCLMPGVTMPGDHQSDGISLTGSSFNFTDYRENEMSPQGVMFYSTDPASEGNVLTAQGTTVVRAAGAPRALPATGGDDASSARLALVLVALGLGLTVAGLAVRRPLG